MRRPLKHYFLPHFDNDYKPYLLREGAVFAVAIAVVLLFGFQYIYSTLVIGSDFYATILPSVIIELTNADRRDASAEPLAMSPVLNEAAKKKAEDMAAQSYFAHTSPEGKTPWHWFGLVGYRFSYAGENLAVHFTESEDVEKAWLNSPGHRANILNKNFTEIGIATAQGTYQGVVTTFVVEMFGRPAVAAAATLPVSNEQQAVNNKPTPPPVKPSPAPALKPITAPPAPRVVATKGVATEPENFETIESNDMFVAVKNTEALAAESAVIPQPSGSLIGSWMKRVMTSPRFVLDVLYGLLAAIVAIPLLLAIVVEVERQHPKHIVYGVFLLLLISTAFYGSRIWLTAQVVII